MGKKDYRNMSKKLSEKEREAYFWQNILRYFPRGRASEKMTKKLSERKCCRVVVLPCGCRAVGYPPIVDRILKKGCPKHGVKHWMQRGYYFSAFWSRLEK